MPEILPIIPFVGVVFSFMGSLSLDHYHFYFLMVLKEMLTFLSLSNPVLQNDGKERLNSTQISMSGSINRIIICNWRNYRITRNWV